MPDSDLQWEMFLRGAVAGRAVGAGDGRLGLAANLPRLPAMAGTAPDTLVRGPNLTRAAAMLAFMAEALWAVVRLLPALHVAGVGAVTLALALLVAPLAGRGVGRAGSAGRSNLDTGGA
jgi:hypothetical protein